MTDKEKLEGIRQAIEKIIERPPIEYEMDGIIMSANDVGTPSERMFVLGASLCHDDLRRILEKYK